MVPMMEIPIEEECYQNICPENFLYVATKNQDVIESKTNLLKKKYIRIKAMIIL